MGRHSVLSGRGPLPYTAYPAVAWPYALPDCKWAGRGWLFLDEGECWSGLQITWQDLEQKNRSSPWLLSWVLASPPKLCPVKGSHRVHCPCV